MTPDLERAARARVAAYPWPSGALYPLVDLALTAGLDGDAACAWVAAWTRLPPAVVRGVLSSRAAPPATGADVVQLCTGLSCRWLGADEALERLRGAGLRVDTVDCLGVCAAAPAMVRGGRVHDGLTPQRLADLVAAGR